MAHGVKQVLERRGQLEGHIPVGVLQQVGLQLGLQLRLQRRRQRRRLGEGQQRLVAVLLLQGRLVRLVRRRRRGGLGVRLADALEHGGELVGEDLVEVCLFNVLFNFVSRKVGMDGMGRAEEDGQT